jgi:hypothetical protein
LADINGEEYADVYRNHAAVFSKVHIGYKGKVLDIHDLKKAYKMVKSRRALGKIVLTFD